MNRQKLIDELERHSKAVKSIIASLREIEKLSGDREINLARIKKQVGKLKDIVSDSDPFPLDILKEWINQFESELRQTEEQVQRRFGSELEQELRQLGITLTGQYPELKAGLFTIELDFEQWQATLWYGSKQEKLSTSPLSVSDIVKRVERAKKELGSQIPEQELLENLYQAYTRVVQRVGEDAPIIKMLGEIAYLLQNPRFYQDPRKDYYKSYSRADFSFDLFRLRRFLAQNPSSRQFRLKTATRAQTKRRSDFLWVPESEDGKGSAYSHLRFEEKRA
ncbi:hypothetical protein FKZ61_008880 [Litorilinea aerophila]|uniref:Uncharacterized protein n=1 Tax=Litorilinea aerophila TaxID=1204385 RepID=A0A540VHD9_9CHLR|nr:hypothetical protein [Litorilinea aerophila]MCC9076222.1 hypothetical protein [Litorilinea aerophila]